jgi:C-terminal processing protease CtpA/Prc
MTGGYTFSAATLVAENLKGQPNVTIVGEETGGGAYGNSAMFLTTVVLPNSGIRVTLPLYRMVLNAKNPKNGRGVFPDVEVKPSSVYIKSGIDAKLEKVKELIRQRKSENISLK